MEKLIYWTEILTKEVPVKYTVGDNHILFEDTFRVECLPSENFPHYHIVDIPSAEIVGPSEQMPPGFGHWDTGSVTDAVKRAVLGALDYKMRKTVMGIIFPG